MLASWDSLCKLPPKGDVMRRESLARVCALVLVVCGSWACSDMRPRGDDEIAAIAHDAAVDALGGRLSDLETQLEEAETAAQQAKIEAENARAAAEEAQSEVDRLQSEYSTHTHY